MMDGHSRDFPLPVGESIPGAGRVFEEVPQAGPKPAGMSLEYSLQTFNELAAANTALQSEVAGLMNVAKEKDVIIADLRERLGEVKEVNAKLEKSWYDQQKLTRAAQEELADANGELRHMRELVAAERRRTERAKGYIDRFLDEEQRLEPQATTPSHPIAAPKGPDLGSILDPIPPISERDDKANWMMGVARARDDHYVAPRRY